ncbi:MAG TPA: dTDP-glucose 4,6-dehydratase [Nitrospinae bacterium]|nr:dTDP-glucose 4,6-dehydratase [Nitrospinota bacterium]
MKKLLITGGAGFIGSECIRQGVKRGYKIIAADKLTYAGDMERIREVERDIVFYNTDIANKEVVTHIFKKEKPDAVVHWAAESHVDRSIMDASPFLETNIKGTQVLLEAAKNCGVERLINISTDEVYGELGKDGQFFETTPLNPNSPYSVSKASQDMLGRAYYRTYGLPVITVRPSNNYGPWQYPEKLIPVVILKAINNEKIPVYGKGENIREWLFASDCVEAVFLILEKGTIGEAYNIGSGEEKRNVEVVKHILQILGKSDRLIEFTKDRPGHDFRYSLNSEKIRKQLDWQSQVYFQDGIEKTVRWYVDNIGWVNKKLEYLTTYWSMAYK